MPHFQSMFPSLIRALLTSPAMADWQGHSIPLQPWLTDPTICYKKNPDGFLTESQECLTPKHLQGDAKASCTGDFSQPCDVRYLSEAAKGWEGFTGSQLQAEKHNWGHGRVAPSVWLPISVEQEAESCSSKEKLWPSAPHSLQPDPTYSKVSATLLNSTTSGYQVFKHSSP